MFADENLGCNCGKYSIKNGKASNIQENEEIDNHRQFAADILGVNLADFDSEE